MKKYVFKPFKVLYSSRYGTDLPILTCDKRYNKACFSAPWFDFALGSGRVGCPIL